MNHQHESAASTGRPFSSLYAAYALVLLFLVSVFGYVDRTIISVLQVQLKTELGLSDTQMGLLTGASFAIVYTVGAIPIARLADRTIRRNLLAASLFVWSAMTALSGFAQGFFSLIVLRMGVAIGEAGCAPTSHSLIADFFPPRRRATAEAIWALSIPLGIMLGLAGGGWLAASVGWRHTFTILGLIGVVATPIVLMTLKEPARGAHDGSDVALETPGFLASCAILWNVRTYRYMTIAIGFHSIVYCAYTIWIAPFYVRLHGLTLPQVAGHLALLTGLGGLIGTFAGGVMADQLGRSNSRWYMWTPMLFSIIAPPFALAQFWVKDANTSWLLAIIPTIAINAYVAPINASTQSLMRPSMRASASSVVVFSAGIFGLTLGPLLVGLTSDLLAPRFGVESLRYGMMVPILLDVLAALFFGIAAVHASKEMVLRDSPRSKA